MEHGLSQHSIREAVLRGLCVRCVQPKTASLARALLALALTATLIAAPSTASAKSRPSGKLIVKVGGTPKGAPIAVRLVGPRQESGRKINIRIRKTRTVIRRAAVGRYTVISKPFRFRKKAGKIRPGARAIPNSKRVTVRVRKSRMSIASTRYGTITNPYSKKPTGDVLSIAGSPTNPTSVVLKGQPNLKRNDVLSIPPGGPLPSGLLAYVVSTRVSSNSTRVQVRPASMYDVVPNMNVTKRVALEAPEVQKAGLDLDISDLTAGCGFSLGVQSPVQNVVVKTEWVNWGTPVGDIPYGSQMLIGFDLVAGFTAEASVGGSCGMDPNGFQPDSKFKDGLVLATTIGPIPVVGKILPHVGVSFDVPVSAKLAARIPVTLGAKATAAVPRPFGPAADLEDKSAFGSPSIETDLQVGKLEDVGANFDIGIAFSGGIGNQLVDISVVSDQGLEFELDKEQGCHWDNYLGRLSIVASAGPASLSTPSWDAYDKTIASLGACARLWGDQPDDPEGPYSQSQIFDRSASITSGGGGAGLAISDDGKTAVSGRIYNPAGDDPFGAALSVFTRSGGSWKLQKVLEPKNDPLTFEGSFLDISGDGNTIAVASYDPTDDQYRGGVQTFSRSGSTWVSSGNFVGAPYTNLGRNGDVALSYDGSRLVVGGESADLTDESGAIDVLRRASGHWVLESELSPSPSYGDTVLPTNVGISDDGSKIVASFSGIVEIYERSGASWTPQLAADFTQPIDGPRTSNRFVAISGSGNTVAVGIPSHNNDEGKVATFDRTAAGWEVGTTLKSELEFPLTFGYRVALSRDGTTLLTQDVVDPPGGLVVYERSNEIWKKIQRISPTHVSVPLQGIGFSLALSGDSGTILTTAALRDSVDDGKAIFALIGFDR